MPLITVLGVLGGVLGTFMVLAFLFAPQLGVLGNWDLSDFPAHVWAQIIAIGIIVVSWVWYVVAKNNQKSRGIDVDFAFKEIPPE
jgi:Na+(H+)/acetate symporter ActP